MADDLITHEELDELVDVDPIRLRDEAFKLRARAEQAEAAVARVRRLCELTIKASCRVQAIDQARDTLAALDDTQASAVPEEEKL